MLTQLNNHYNDAVLHSRSQLTTSINTLASNFAAPIRDDGGDEAGKGERELLPAPVNDNEILPPQVTFSDFKDQTRQLYQPTKEADQKHLETQSQPDQTIEQSSLKRGSLQAPEDSNAIRRKVVRERKIGSTDATVDKRIRHTFGQSAVQAGRDDYSQECAPARDSEGLPPHIGRTDLAQDGRKPNGKR